MAETEFVCAEDGVAVAVSRSGGKAVHVAELPENTPEHDAKPINKAVYMEFRTPLATLRQAAGAMLQHHATVHPVTDCEWYRSLYEAWRRA